MKVLQLGKFYPPDIGGIETVIYDITELLNQKGIKCDVLCSNSARIYKEELINGYKVFRTKSYGKIFSTSVSPQMIFKLREIIGNYDIIHIHFPDPLANIALMLSQHKNKKIVLHWHSDIIKQKKLLYFYYPFQEWLLKRADKIIATTPKYIEGSQYLQRYKYKTVAIPIGIDKKRLKTDEFLVNKIKSKYQNRKIIFSLGRLTYYKGFEFLIKAAKYLNKESVVLIGGQGELKDQLIKLIKNNNLQNKVYLLGKIPYNELGSYYAACDVFCLPSIARSEAFGIVQIEAMSFAKPVVATKIPGSGVDWVNVDKVTGINVKPANEEELAKGINQILTDNNLYKKYACNALRRFEKYFTRTKMCNDIIKIYNSL